jgi:hypothetical protein
MKINSVVVKRPVVYSQHVQPSRKSRARHWRNSYAAMARFAPVNVPRARIIRVPQVTKAYAEWPLLAHNSTFTTTYS